MGRGPSGGAPSVGGVARSELQALCQRDAEVCVESRVEGLREVAVSNEWVLLVIAVWTAYVIGKGAGHVECEKKHGTHCD